MTLAFLGAGVWSLVAQQVLLVCLGTLTLWLLADERPRFQLVWPRVRELLPFGLFSTSQQLLAVVVPRAFMLLVGGYLGSKSVGVLSLAFRGLDMLRDLLVQAVSQVAMPLFSRIQEDREALDHAYGRAVALTAFVTYPIFVGLAVCAEEVVLVVFGAQWTEAAPYFALVSLLTLPFFLRMYSGSYLKALGKPAAPGAELVAQAVYLVPMMLLFGRHSVDHAMLVWASRLAVSVPVDMWVQRRMSGLSLTRQLHGTLVPAIAALVMAAGVLLVKRLTGDWPAALRLLAMITSGAAAYASLALIANRELARQLTALIGTSIQRRG
jgi:PST family polysaccharide transporter